ncbi:hypothetical protein R6Y99_08635 [Pseudomonas lundensis]|uniref:hypothetical protein n=1 Tax=Serratia proteamaculans TaxID=28151 RepID=UPI002981E827|nr:hypothetical protein [Serratia proteamaculans]MDW5499852.1 hypothetical protein [Serratia proteamaculans]MDW5504917.1 hypothetical protein [Pseudomonas lundensis]
MTSFRIGAKLIFFLTENERFPAPDHNSAIMLAIRGDEEGQGWLYTYHNRRWQLVSETPYSTENLAIDAALTIEITDLYAK